MILKNSELILKEIEKVFSWSDFTQAERLIDGILSSGKILCIGAGRMGYALRGCAMRLKHLGLDSYMLGDTNVPHIGQGDLLIIGSGSGETESIFKLSEIAKKNGAQIALITGNVNSRMGRIADILILLRAPSKVKPIEGFVSQQPMTTLNEQAIGIFFDSLVLDLMSRMGETHETMWGRHSNIE